MKRILFIMIAIAAVLTSCNDYETYGEKKEKERNAISEYISKNNITVISEDKFKEQGEQTNVEKNEFVRLDKNGVYMQIVRSGVGKPLEDKARATIVCRFTEFDILADSVTWSNNVPKFASVPDLMYVSRTSSVYTASFLSGIMYSIYSQSVPAGWLVPMPYIKIDRPQSINEECAKVRLIVPHTQGHATASSNVKPYYYEITYQKEL